jgi:catalase
MTNGFTSFPEHIAEDKVRGKAELFADHYSQAKLFWISQTPLEQQHIINAFRFELTRVQTQAVRERVVSLLVNVDAMLAEGVAGGLGFPVPSAAPLVSTLEPPQFGPSPALSLFGHPGDGSIKTRRIAILVADGVDTISVRRMYSTLLADGAVPRFVGAQLGQVNGGKGQEALNVDVSMEALPSVLYDAVIVPDGQAAVDSWSAAGPALEFLRDQYRHCKPMLAIGAAKALFDKADLSTSLPDGSPDNGMIVVGAGDSGNGLIRFQKALGAHRTFARETTPPKV